MTDNEIIKALENCRTVDIEGCRDCPYKKDGNCINRLETDVLNLINRLLPCKVGDEVWVIRNCFRTVEVKKGKVAEIYFVDESMKPCIVVKGAGRGFWGEKIFPTFEAAESYLQRTV